MALYAHGYDNVAMYDGSWTEWHQDATTPKDDATTMLGFFAQPPKKVYFRV